MSGFYVLDVPEFSSLVRAVGQNQNCIVHPALGGYRYVQFSGSIELQRRDTELQEAVWFGCLTAGLDGKIASFTKDAIRLVETNEPV